MQEKNKTRLKAVLFAVIIILANFFQIRFLIFGKIDITDFRCDAEQIGYKMYKADVNQEINFIYDAEFYETAAVFLGDGTYLDFVDETSTFSHSYSTEGVYNVTLWAIGSGNHDSEWMIINVENDAPEFDIGYTSVEYYDATYDFEDDELGGVPEDWVAFNNEGDYYLSHDTILFPGNTIQGSVNNLKIEDQVTWDIESEWSGGDYRFIEIFLKFDEKSDHKLTAGQYELYFSANDTMALLGYNPILGEKEILFSGDYANGQIITIKDPSNLELFASYYIENLAINDIIKIDWFKLRRVSKGAEVEFDEYDHSKIVKLDFGTSNQYCGITQNFAGQQYGSIEFWYKTENTRLGAKMFFGNNLGITQRDNKWFIGAEDITPESPPLNNTWYHLRIDFLVSGSSYHELTPGDWRPYINDLPSPFDPSLPYSVTSINSFTFETNGSAYIDAIGYTWDSNYYIGKNTEKITPDHLYEDYEITFNVVNLKESDVDKKGFSYEQETSLGEKYQYIWDFGDGNYSYDESPTYRFSNEGEFPVRLTLIDDQGAMKTVVKNFVVENKHPKTDIVYGLNYDVTYDFKYDVSNQPPTDWITHGNVKVVEFKDEFSKVVEVDTTTGGYGMIRIPEPSLDQNGSIEFWIYFTDIAKDEFFFFVDKLNPNDENLYALKKSTRFGFLNGKWMYYYTYKGAGDVDKYAYVEMTELPSPINNEWMHVRFDYCWADQVEYKGLSDKEWRIYVDGVPSNVHEAVGDEFNRKGFDIKSGSKIYLESIGFTTDKNYNLGDNNPERLKTYYGTWDFRFYPNGPIPFDETLKSTVLGPWVFGSYNFEKIANNCSANILNELDGHSKVLELQDNNSSDLVFASLIDLAEPKAGTFEFWLRTTDTSQGLVIALGYEIFHSGIWLGEDGNWWYKNGNKYLNIDDVPKMQNNTWHHIRIDFNCSSGQFYFAVDGNFSKLGPFDFDYKVENFGWNIWSTVHEGYNYSIFLDAIGASWDPAYEIGDNLNTREAIYSDTEIIFSADSDDTKTDKENLRYLWNFGDNQTGFGQTVLHSYSRSGKYKVSLTVVDDNQEYDIAEKYVWIDNMYPSIDLTEVHYGRTTYDFTYDNAGDFPSDWYRSDLEMITKNITKIIANIDIFSNVVMIGNGTGVGGIWTSSVEGLPYNQTNPGTLSLTNGTIEFWIYTSDVSKSQFYISFFQDTFHDGIYIEFLNGTWKHNNVEIEFENLWALKSKVWTHVRVDFCCDFSSYKGLDNDTFIIYADGYASQVLDMVHDLHTDISNLTCFGIFTDMNQVEMTHIYVDNFGFSWDPNYNIGDNELKYIQYHFNEGETIILDCMSYDTFTDYQQLIYNWGDLYMNIGEWKDLGWHYSYTFMDNDDGDALEGYPIISFVGDPLYMWDIDSYNIEVDNVLPSLNIHSAKVVANISLSIYSDGPEAANFTVYLSSSGYNQTIFKALIPSNAGNTWLDFNWTLIEMDASKDWNVIVNQTEREGGEQLVQLSIQFLNGYEVVVSNNFDGIEDIWAVDLDEMWINDLDNLALVPLTYGATICDPSNDKIKLGIDYVIEVIHEVALNTPHNYYNFTITQDSKIIQFEMQIDGNSSNTYATSRFTYSIPDDWSTLLTSGSFPVSYDIEFIADLTDLDILGTITNLFANEGISVLTQKQISYKIHAEYNEIQPLSKVQNFNLRYDISDHFEFDEVAPAIQNLMLLNVTEDQLETYYTEVNDLNGDNVTVKYSFGINNGNGLIYRDAEYLGNNRFGLNYTYSNAGTYLINVIASDGLNQSKSIHLIDVINLLPYAKIRTYQNVTFEDEYIKFNADIYDSESDIDTVRYFWDFGDGYFSTQSSPTHSFSLQGIYNVKLKLKDDNGGTYTASYNITVLDQPPQILGPFSFTGTEGQTIVLDVDAVDAISNFYLNYTWEIYKANKIYNATYNFMEVANGNIPGVPFEFVNNNGISYQVIDEIAGHTKVLEMQDTNDQLNGSWSLKYGDTSSINGTIEFWLRSSYISEEGTNFAINLLQYGSGMIPIYVGDNGTWIYRNIFSNNQSKILELPRLTSNKWHHIRIDYECTDGKYSDLGQYEWRIIVDGVSSPVLSFQYGNPPDNVCPYLDTLQIVSGNPEDMIIYCDAIGYYDGKNIEYQIRENTYLIFQEYDFVKTIYGARPSLAFEAGSYLINLKVENILSSEAKIIVEVEAVTPILAVPSKNYYGNTGYIDITAYAWDSIIDSTSLEYEWIVKDKRVLLESGTLSSTISVFCNDTGRIKGSVSVRDAADLSTTSEFFVQVFMDSNGDGISNEFERLHNITSPDMDGDGLPNFYENRTTRTDMYNWDTDNDRLSDGYSSDVFSGELTIGTDPLNNDTDGDLLDDGFEWFGWNHTLMRASGPQVVKYTSNPVKADTDGDSLDDYGEYLSKTNPRDPDTDDDGLLDSFEVFTYGSNPTIADSDGDGLLDGMEYELGTHWDEADTDGDGIDDGVEYYGWAFTTNPLTKDSDGDFLPDSSESILYDYEIDGRKTVNDPVELMFEQKKVEKADSASISFLLTYGETTPEDYLSDIRVQIFKQDSEIILFDETFSTHGTERYFTKNTDIKDLIEKSGDTYYGKYVLKVSYLSTPHGDLCLESFKISVHRYLDPNDNDYDNDNIMDGVETGLLVEGTKKVEFNESVNIISDTNSTTFSRFKLEIDDLGTINDADIYFRIVSNQTLVENGNITVTVIQSELDDRVEDKILDYSTFSFFKNDLFNTSFHVEPDGYAPYNFYGAYYIIVDVFDANSTDGFILTDISTEVDGYRDATSSDTEAWITRPDLADSDDDGWSDYYEIHRTEPTNPIAWDTDGDGIKDSKDINPLYDIILKVYLDEGHIGDLPRWYVLIEDHPSEQMTVSYNYQGDYVAYATKHVSASKGQERAGATSLTDYKGTSVFHKSHYINIEDDIYSIDLKFKLWDEGLGGKDVLWDTPKMSKTYTHDLRSYGIGDKYVSGTKRSGDNWIKYEVTTLGLSRVNTIAMYANTSIFNGHYNQIESMHVFQLEVTTLDIFISSNSPFVYGKNVLLIPNSIFTKTVLNSIIQNETLLANSILAKGEFMSLDRDDLPDSASAMVQSQFKITVTAVQAQQILDWARMGVVNESTNEIGVINFYASTKLDGFRAEMMNLHPEVLILVEILNPYKDSSPGSMPKDAGEYWADLFEAIVKAFVDFITAVLEILVSIIKAIVDVILFLVELLIKAALLIFIWLVFAISLLVILAVYGLIVGVMLAISVFLDVDIELELNQITVTGAISLEAGYDVGSTYNDFLELDIPTIESHFEAFDFRFEYSYSFISLFMGFTKVPGAIFNFTRSLTTIISAMGKTMALCGTFFVGVAAILNFSPTYTDGGIKLVAAIVGWLVAVGMAISAELALASDKEVIKEAYIGMGIGYVISGIAALISGFPSVWKQVASIPDFKDQLKEYKDFFKDVKSDIDLADTLDIYSTGEVEKMIRDASFDLLLGAMGLGIGTAALAWVWDTPSRNIAIYGIGLLCVVIGVAFIIQGINTENES